MREKAFFWVNVCVLTVFVLAVGALFIKGEGKLKDERLRQLIKNNFERIASGMSQEQVEAILGPGTVPSDLEFRLYSRWGRAGDVPLEWHDSHGSIYVSFRKGRVVFKEYYPDPSGQGRRAYRYFLD